MAHQILLVTLLISLTVGCCLASPVEHPAVLTDEADPLPPCPASDPSGSTAVYFASVDCTKFWECSNGGAIKMPCPGGLNFDTALNVCSFPDQAKCTGKGWSDDSGESDESSESDSSDSSSSEEGDDDDSNDEETK